MPYIDSVILTDTHSGAWNSSSNGTLAVRRYLLQNWRSDVVATTTDDGTPYEYVRYSPYGVPTSYPAADANRDMVTDATDENDWLTVFGGGSAPIVINIDTNKDDLFPDTGDFDFMADEAVSGKLGGYNKMGMAGAGPSLRFAYAGYAWDPAIKSYHVRHRVYSADMGRWLTRDPVYLSSHLSQYAYLAGSALSGTDSTGLAWDDWIDPRKWIDWLWTTNEEELAIQACRAASQAQVDSCTSSCLKGYDPDGDGKYVPGKHEFESCVLCCIDAGHIRDRICSDKDGDYVPPPITNCY